MTEIKTEKSKVYKSLELATAIDKKQRLVLHRGLPLNLAGPRIVYSRFSASPQGSLSYQTIHSMTESGGNDLVISGSSSAAFYDDTPSISQRTGQVVFTRGSSVSGGGGLFVMDSDGANVKQLTNPPSGSWDVQPMWSPGGRYIAFVRSYQIFLKNADGSNQRPLFNYSGTSGLDHAPTWNPSESEIAFWRERGGVSTIYKVPISLKTSPAASGGLVNLSNTSMSEDNFDAWPAWSPDGTKFAFFRNHEIWVMAADGTLQQNISKPNHDVGEEDMTPCWSPDGTMIAFSRTNWVSYHIWIMNLTGTIKNQLSYGEYVCDFYPSWQKY